MVQVLLLHIIMFIQSHILRLQWDPLPLMDALYAREFYKLM